MIHDFKLDPWSRTPQCKLCDSPAEVQRIDTSKLGTREYCTYLCHTHRSGNLTSNLAVTTGDQSHGTKGKLVL